MRPVLDSGRGETHEWSVSTAEEEHSIKLEGLEEGTTRLAACMPLPESLRQGIVGTCPLASTAYAEWQDYCINCFGIYAIAGRNRMSCHRQPVL